MTKNETKARDAGIAARIVNTFDVCGYGPFYAYRDACAEKRFTPGTEASIWFMKGWKYQGAAS